MEYYLENEHLCVCIKDEGAEVISVKDEHTGCELWWHGDPAFWAGHSPILFPACGGLWDGTYHYNGASYKMPKHGYVKKATWQMTDNTQPNAITFSITDNEESRSIFPFSYRIDLTYTLTGRQLRCDALVHNLTDGRTMFYQLGGHPAIALPDYAPDATVIGYIRPHCASHITPEHLSVSRAGEQGCLGAERFPLPMQDGLIPISNATFAHEALILDKAQTNGMTLLMADGKTPIADVTYDAPVCLLWQQQHVLCPYVCVEPWYGAPDRQQYTVDLDMRPYAQHAMPGETRSHAMWQIAFAQ